MALADLSMEVGTAMQLRLVAVALQAAQALFLQEALRITDPDVPIQLSSLRCVFNAAVLTAVGEQA